MGTRAIGAIGCLGWSMHGKKKIRWMYKVVFIASQMKRVTKSIFISIVKS